MEQKTRDSILSGTVSVAVGLIAIILIISFRGTVLSTFYIVAKWIVICVSLVGLVWFGFAWWNKSK